MEDVIPPLAASAISSACFPYHISHPRHPKFMLDGRGYLYAAQVLDAFWIDRHLAALVEQSPTCVFL